MEILSRPSANDSPSSHSSANGSKDESCKLNLDNETYEHILKRFNVDEACTASGKVLGSGVFSIVYTSKDNKTGDIVAVKKISLKNINEKLARALSNETTLIKTLDHPNIVKTLNIVVHNQNLYIIMEYCNAGTLADYIPIILDHVEKERIVRPLFKQLVAALYYIRKSDILHRDLKPCNILLTKNMDDKPSPLILKLGDFGFARLFGELELSVSVCGTPFYMAPELFQGKGYNTKSDIWSVGIILHEMLSGKTPYGDVTSLTELKRKITTTVPSIKLSKDSVSSECFDLLHVLLNRDPLLRIGWYELFTHPFVVNEIKLPPKSHPIPICTKETPHKEQNNDHPLTNDSHFVRSSANDVEKHQSTSYPPYIIDDYGERKRARTTSAPTRPYRTVTFSERTIIENEVREAKDSIKTEVLKKDLPTTGIFSSIMTNLSSWLSLS
jgi:serine/threonine protein kinase